MTHTLRAFHSDPAVKAKYLARVDAHILADSLVKGTGWENGKGCAIGCTLEAYDHSRYPIELGIPRWLAELEDKIFEGMSLEESRTWPRDFLAAITPGADLERVKAPFLIMVLQSALETFDHAKFPDVKAAIDGSIALWQRDDIGSEDWNEAATAATATAAATAARAAAAAATATAATAATAAAAAATTAATAARAAAAAATAAATAARAAAWAATESREVKYDHFADQLLIMLENAA